MKRDRRGPAWPPITRRDFLHGTGVALGGCAGLLGLTAEEQALASLPPPGAPYPPALQGLRGNHEGSQTYPHLLRDGGMGASELQPHHTGEEYDLVVVGAGISGLSAAYFYRQRFGRQARVLLLDNHDDFGGHARRNEFEVDGKTLLSYAGTQAIDNPSTYRASAKQLLQELGINTGDLGRQYDQALYASLGTACFFDKETFGVDRLVTGMGSKPWDEFLRASPLSEQVRSDVQRLYTQRVDYLQHLSLPEKKRLLKKISYADYLISHCGVHRDTLAFFQTYSHDLFGVGIDAVSAFACYENPDDYKSFTYPAFNALGFEEVEEDPYIYMFPDGNATISRLLVRELIPSAIAASGWRDIVTARARYDRLDVAGSPVRLRLSSPVVRVEHRTGHAGSTVDIDYMANGSLHRVSARHCVLACYHAMIPYIWTSLPDTQKAALHYCVKVPYLYTHVAIRNWRSFQQLGVHQIVSPGSYHSYTGLAFPVNAGAYRCAHDPQDPMVLFMLRAPCAPGLPRRDQHRAGRAELVRTSFDTIEHNVRDQLQRMLGGAGFDADRDIAGLTVNRWAHGYAYEYDSLWDPDWPKGQAPNEIGRRGHGPIAIANSDSAAAAYTDAAIDQAHRAVGELWHLAQSDRAAG